MDLLASEYTDDADVGSGGEAAAAPAFKPQPRLLAAAPVVAAPPTSGVARAAAAAAASNGAAGSSSALVSYSAGGAGGSALTVHGGAGAGVDASSAALHTALTTGVLTANLPADQLWAPAVGPVQPHAARRFVNDGSHTIVGSLASEAMEGVTFEGQFRAFNTHGVAADPTGRGGLVASASAAPALASSLAGSGTSVAAASLRRQPPSMPAGLSVQLVKRARQGKGDVTEDVDSWRGPWAAYEGDEERRKSALESGNLTDAQKKLRLQQGYHPDRAGKLEKDEATPELTPAAAGATGGAFTRSVNNGGGSSSAASASSSSAAAAASAAGVGGGKGGKKGGATSAKSGTAALIEAGKGHVPGQATNAEEDGAGGGSSSAAAAGGARSAEEEAAAAAAAAGEGVGIAGTSSVFHGRELRDYQGRSWVEPPKGLRADGGDHECFLPKKAVHKYTGHSKGVSSVGFIPGTGHLLLTASLDTKCKVWDVVDNRQVRRTYSGHTGAVRQANFSGDGKRFLSVSYDKTGKVWDTETGACTVNLAPGCVPFCGTWHPEDPATALLGCANRKIMQYDVRTGECVLEYNYHLGPVNAVLFVDDNRRIVSTSDDKKVLVWEFGAPVPIKYIADPSMHSIPALAAHPTEEAFVGQSMDNCLMGFFAGERVGINRKKVYRGHVTAGFACQPAFSPDGSWLASGDGEGSLWFWDWKTGKMLKKLARAHEGGPAIGLAWHPLQPSWVASCGWDGVVKLWD